ncbi:hypothetical protein DRP04_01070 [Archaeoglobales archaeon]|nr:MAG: hypothetical protein DRP04_01070 [Archaeoglobales archaeon]
MDEGGTWKTFKSDWKTEFENFKLSLRFASRKLKVILVLALLAYLAMASWLLLQGKVFPLVHLLWPALFVLLRCKPKKYGVIFRGVLINGQLYTWKNVKGYVRDGDKVRLVMYNNDVITLPAEADVEKILLMGGEEVEVRGTYVHESKYLQRSLLERPSES